MEGSIHLTQTEWIDLPLSSPSKAPFRRAIIDNTRPGATPGTGANGGGEGIGPVYPGRFVIPLPTTVDTAE